MSNRTRLALVVMYLVAFVFASNHAFRLGGTAEPSDLSTVHAPVPLMVEDGDSLAFVPVPLEFESPEAAEAYWRSDGPVAPEPSGMAQSLEREALG